MASMFLICPALTSAPLFNTTSVTNMSTMFGNCYSLTSVPLFNTTSVTNMSSMFSGCRSLTSVPAMSAAAATSSSSYTNMFNACNALSSIKMTGYKYTFTVASCKLSAAALDELYGNLDTVSAQTITVTSNHGTDADTPSIATAKGWTVTGS
jgi:surface protein